MDGRGLVFLLLLVIGTIFAWRDEGRPIVKILAVIVIGGFIVLMIYFQRKFPGI